MISWLPWLHCFTRSGIGVAVVGLAVGLVFGITSYQDSQQEIDTFARMSVPGTVTLQVDEPGQQVVYYEGEQSAGLDDVVVSIIDPVGARHRTKVS